MGGHPFFADFERVYGASSREEAEVLLAEPRGPACFLEADDGSFADRREVEVEGPFDAPRDEADEGRRAAVVRLPERPVVRPAVVPQDNHEGVAVLQEHAVHQQPRDPAVALEERVNANEPVVEDGGELDRPQLVRVRAEPLHQLNHSGLDFLWHRRHEVRSCDSYLPGSVGSRRLVGSIEQYCVDLQDVRLFDAPLGQLLNVGDGRGVVPRLKDLPQALPARREALLDDHLGLPQGQRVPLNRVRVERVLNRHLTAQLPHYLGRQRPSGVQLPLLSEHPVVHFVPQQVHQPSTEHGPQYTLSKRYKNISERMKKCLSDTKKYRLEKP